MTTTDKALAQFTDEALNAEITDAKAKGYETGYSRTAVYLLELDTPERRLRAERNAHTMSNLQDMGRWSDAVRTSVRILSMMIRAGTEGGETWAERIAREYREADRQSRGF